MVRISRPEIEELALQAKSAELLTCNVKIHLSPPKITASSEAVIFYPSRRLGISSALTSISRKNEYIIKGGKPPLYLITL